MVAADTHLADKNLALHMEIIQISVTSNKRQGR